MTSCSLARVITRRNRDSSGWRLATSATCSGRTNMPLDLRCLIGAAHPPLDAGVGVAGGTVTGQGGSQVTHSKPDQRMVWFKRGHDNLADLARTDRIAGAGPHDFENEILVHDQPVTSGCLVGNEADIGCGIGLESLNALRLDPCLKGWGEGGARHHSSC